MFQGTISFNSSIAKKRKKHPFLYTKWIGPLLLILFPLLMIDAVIFISNIQVSPAIALEEHMKENQTIDATISATQIDTQMNTNEGHQLSHEIDLFDSTILPPAPSPTIPPILNSIPDLPPNNTQTIHKPLESYKKLTTQFSRFHPAIDLSAKPGTTVFAILPGKVSHSGWSNDGFGNSVVIETSNGSWTRYAHLSHTLVVIGNTVSPGQVIGTVGCTGNCSGPHLHLQVFQNGEFINPLTFLQ